MKAKQAVVVVVVVIARDDAIVATTVTTANRRENKENETKILKEAEVDNMPLSFEESVYLALGIFAQQGKVLCLPLSEIFFVNKFKIQSTSILNARSSPW